MFKCTCSICQKYSNKEVVYWIKQYDINKKDITWKDISWFASIGFINSKLMYMKYIWGSKYKRVFKNTENATDISWLFLLLCKLLHYIKN